MPKVSVVIPCYNYAGYLPDAVNSVREQSYADWELTIVNDGSTDATADIAERLAADHPRITVLHKENGGVSSARNAGIRRSTGEYVLCLDADDMIAPTMLAKTVSLLDSAPHVGIAYGDFLVFGDPLLPQQGHQFEEYDFELLKRKLIMFYCSLYRREAWERTGGYDETMAAGEDWDFWLGCGEHGFFGQRIPDWLFAIRAKSEGLHNEAMNRDFEWRARIVLNHPRLYNEVTRRWADAIVAGFAGGFPGGDADDRCPAEILSRASELNGVMVQLNRLNHELLYHNREIHHLKQRLSEVDSVAMQVTGSP